MMNKNIIVFGADGLIGKKLILDLMNREFTVIACDLQIKNLISLQKSSSFSERLLVKKCDITKEKEIKKVFKEVLKEKGYINGCVNCAYPKNKSYGKEFFEVSQDNFCSNLSYHLGGYFSVMQVCSNYSLENNIPFSLVQFSSIYGVISPSFEIYKDTGMTSSVEYSAIKSSLIHLTKYLTSYTKGSEFRVNCISPGGIFDSQKPIFVKRYKKRSRKKGMLDPEDLFGTVYFLLSDESEYVCGQNIVIDDSFSV